MSVADLCEAELDRAKWFLDEHDLDGRRALLAEWKKKYGAALANRLKEQAAALYAARKAEHPDRRAAK